MSVPRFYHPPPLPTSTVCELPPAAAHHASRVLRLRVGDAVQIFDGLGNALDATLHAIQGKRVLLGNLQPFIGPPEPTLHIVLAQSLCSNDRMDWIVQKATELGTAEIVPLIAQRSVPRLREARADRRIEHWRAVAIAACEQCGRNTLPLIHPPRELRSWLAQRHDRAGSSYILLPGGATTLHKLAPPQQECTLLIGPEGGFTEEEARQAQQTGFIPVSLGSRLLRTETAALAALSAIQTLWGDFR